MATHRYWVVGADYADTEFRVMRNEAPTVKGPFDSEEEATVTWRQLSAEATHLASVRYSILSERFRHAG
jgi:hypothetical protein